MFKVILLTISGVILSILCLSSADEPQMECKTGPLGSLTVYCTGIVPSYLKKMPFQIGRLEENLECKNCNFSTISWGTFDIQGNRIKQLTLSDSKINELSNSSFIGLVFLITLDLSKNNITRIRPETFKGVKKVTFLDLSNNAITELGDNAFLELIELNTLRLDNNKILRLSAKTFNGLGKIRNINLKNNRISQIVKEFNNLTTLWDLSLDNNRILELTNDSFDNLTSLISLTISNNMLLKLSNLSLVSLENLNVLDLSSNKLNTIEVEVFSKLRNLDNLNLFNNSIQSILSKQFSGLVSLTHLNLSKNVLSEFKVSAFAGLPHLQVLDLSNNSIGVVNTSSVFPILNLHSLNLANNKLNDIDYASLIHRTPKIAFLDLKGNAWPCEFEHELAEYFQNDNFKFSVLPNSVPCVVKENEKLFSKIFNNFSEREVSFAGWEFGLLFLLFILLTGISLIQYKMFKHMNYDPLLNKETHSEVRLISSDLEAREDDYFNE